MEMVGSPCPIAVSSFLSPSASTAEPQHPGSPLPHSVASSSLSSVSSLLVLIAQPTPHS